MVYHGLSSQSLPHSFKIDRFVPHVHVRSFSLFVSLSKQIMSQFHVNIFCFADLTCPQKKVRKERSTKAAKDGEGKITEMQF